MADSARYVFRATSDAHTQITRLFDFIEPTAIAMWNLRWQVQGFLTVVPSATSTDVSNRFSLGSGFRGGSIKRAAADITWEQQQEQFANVILVNAIAAFEDFTTRMESLSNKKDLSKNLQFPGIANKTKGVLNAYADLGSDIVDLTGVFFYDPAVLRRHSKSPQHLLLCYRYFKELRNCIAHRGGKSSQAAVDAYLAFAPIATPSLLGVEGASPHTFDASRRSRDPKSTWRNWIYRDHTKIDNYL
ncbi:MAG: hypothetical protein JWR75_1670 [Devosia sp.]|nr:hypothetical protein [Devosia sp.]